MSELLTGFDDRQVYAVVKSLEFRTVLKGRPIVPLFLVDILKQRRIGQIKEACTPKIQFDLSSTFDITLTCDKHTRTDMGYS